MNNFEWLLKNLGWKPTVKVLGLIDKRYYNPNEPNTWIDTDNPTYDFISSIPIEDEHKYLVAMAKIMKYAWNDANLDQHATDNLRVLMLHNASLDARIEAHCKARGM